MKYLLLVLLLISSNSYSNDQVKSFIDNLRSQGIDTIGVFNTSCSGWYGGDDADPCMHIGINDNTYIQWQKAGKLFMAKINECFSYKTLEFKNSVMFDFFKTYKTNIKQEKIFPDGCELKIVNGDTICEGFIIGDHTCKTIVALYTPTDSVRIYIQDNDFEKKPSNAYYEHNMKLKSYKWSRLIQYQIEEIEKRNRFVRK